MFNTHHYEKSLSEVSLIPRILPANYKPVVEDSCRLLTRLVLDTLYDNKINHKLNGSKLATILKEEGALENLPNVLVGSARFDLAVQGDPTPDNPPGLIEFNLVDYGGIGWIPRMNKVYLNHMKELPFLVEHDNFIPSFYRNFMHLGNRFLMVMDGGTQYEDYDLFREEIRKYGMRFDPISCDDFAKEVTFSANSLNWQGTRYDAIYLKAFSMEEEVESN